MSEPTVHRREADSGRVSYADRVVLHETSRTRVELVPFFIQRTHGTDLAVKIVSYRKADEPPWEPLAERSVSLQAEAVQRLHAALRRHLGVSARDEDGQYLLIRAENLGLEDLVAVLPAELGVFARLLEPAAEGVGEKERRAFASLRAQTDALQRRIRDAAPFLRSPG